VPGLPYLIDVSPDGSDFLVGTLKQNGRTNWVWIVPALGGSLRRLDDAHDAAFSPDGRSIVYTTPEGDIFIARVDGEGARKLTSARGYIENLAWSPDGGTIRFTKDDRLWEISSSGFSPHQLLPNWHVSSHYCCGRWTADGKFFVFVSDPGGSKRLVTELWAIDERRGFFRRPPTEPVQLTNGPVSWDWRVPGKDGTRIFAEGTIHRGELSRFESKIHQFEPFLGGISAEFVSFSKDGQSVAYVSFPEGVLWKVNRDGKSRVQLSEPPILPVLPRWSPDGTQIAFTNLSSWDHPEMYTVSTEGSSPPAASSR
jgi:Tol biopolymer transport system component